MTNDWAIWQLADSAFPSGGFAHSGGLEAAWQLGEIQDSRSLENYLGSQLLQSGNMALPYLLAVHRGPDNFELLDQRHDAFVKNHIARKASCAQGQAILVVAAKAFSIPRLTELRKSCTDGDTPLHLPTVFGLITRLLEIDADQAARLWLHTLLRDLISSAVRLGIVGSLQGQAIQRNMTPASEKTLQRCLNLSVEQAAQTTPVIDLLQGTHDRLYSKLFQT
jgi:urease accessory protein